MKKLMLILVVLAAMWQVCVAGDTLDDPGNNKILWVQNFEGLVRDCAFMPDENYIIHTLGPKLQVRKTIDQSFVREKEMSEGIINSLDVSKDGKFVAIGGGSMLKVLDINTFEVIKEYKKGSTNSVSLSPDGKLLAYLGPDTGNQYIAKAFVINIETGEQIFKFGQDINEYQDIANVLFSPDGKWLACNYRGGDDKRIFVFDTETWQLYYGFNGDDQTPFGAAGYRLLFSPNSKYLLAPDANGKAFRVWEINTKIELTPTSIKLLSSPLIFLNDNETLFCNSAPYNIFFYNFKTNKILKELNFYAPFFYPVFNKDETLLLGDRLGLMQIDKSILSVEPEETDEKDNLLIPNPATNEVMIKSKLPYNDFVSIDLTDITGKLIKVIYSQFVNEGAFEFRFNITNLAPGSYFFRLRQRSFSITFKLVKEG